MAAFSAELPESTRRRVSRTLTHGTVEFGDSYLEFDHYKGGGRNIEALGNQLNACYEMGLYDGCAVLVRKLLETLLVLSFVHVGEDAAIRDANNNYLTLPGIITVAQTNAKLNLSRNVIGYLGDVVERGNLSVRKIFYTARKKDLDGIDFKVRVIVEELMHKSGKK